MQSNPTITLEPTGPRTHLLTIEQGASILERKLTTLTNGTVRAKCNRGEWQGDYPSLEHARFAATLAFQADRAAEADLVAS